MCANGRTQFNFFIGKGGQKLQGQFHENFSVVFIVKILIIIRRYSAVHVDALGAAAAAAARVPLPHTRGLLPAQPAEHEEVLT